MRSGSTREFNHTGDIWHIEVEGVTEGQLYLWRVDGPRDPPRATVSTATALARLPGPAKRFKLEIPPPWAPDSQAHYRDCARCAWP